MIQTFDPLNALRQVKWAWHQVRQHKRVVLVLVVANELRGAWVVWQLGADALRAVGG